MRYRIVVGDRNTVRGVVEIEAAGYSITEGMLNIFEDPELRHVFVTYANGAWRSITDVETFRTALKAGSSDENPARRETPRSLQAL